MSGGRKKPGRGGDQSHLRSISPPWSFTEDDQREREGEAWLKREATLVSELSQLLGVSQRWRWVKGARPASEDFSRMDDAVTKLAKFTRDRGVSTLCDCYEVVNKRYPKLELLKRIEKFVEEAIKVPARPMTALMNKEGDGRAGEFHRTWTAFRRGTLDVAAVDWQRFAPLLAGYRLKKEVQDAAAESLLTTRLDKLAGRPNLTAYAVFLEIDGEDRAWVADWHKAIWPLVLWVNGTLCNKKLAGMVDCYYGALGDPAELLETQRTIMRRAQGAERVRRARSKKSGR